ncbi:MAG TPA: hypothetical protein PK954_00645, partial [Anaerolineales bacterium]|nr:hypothetical protein [Anaerolineales bacterium]
MALSVAPGNGQGHRRAVDGSHTDRLTFNRERHANDPRARPDIDDMRWPCRQALERDFDKQLGLGPGHKHRFVNVKLEPEEFAPASQIRQRGIGG